MHKKLTSELISLANSILSMPEDADIVSLHKKSRKLYEKLSVLKFIEKNMETAIVAPKKVRKEVIEKTPASPSPAPIVSIPEEKAPEKAALKEENQAIKEKPIAITKENSPKEEIETPSSTNEIDAAIKAAKDIQKATELKYSLESEFKDAVSADMAQDIFERADRRVTESDLSAPKSEPIKKTLNQSGLQQGIQIGLNDRIAFVKYLFNGNLTDFNRVLSQLNTFTNQKEATGFIIKMVKPDYNWNDHEDIENRLLEIIERKFS